MGREREQSFPYLRHNYGNVKGTRNLDLWALRFLVVWEIDCGNWPGLARGYKHCDLFYPLGLGSDWVYHKLGTARSVEDETQIFWF